MEPEILEGRMRPLDDVKEQARIATGKTLLTIAAMEMFSVVCHLTWIFATGPLSRMVFGS